jgi:integrase-like protein
MVQRRRCSAEYKREAVAMLESPGVTVNQIAAELGIGATVLGDGGGASCGRNRRRRFGGMVDHGMRTWPFCGGNEPASRRSGSCCEKRPRASRARRDEGSDDSTMPHGVSHPDDVPMCAGLVEWLLWLGDPATEWAGPGERPTTGTDSSAAGRAGRRHGPSAHLGRPARCRGALLPSPGGAADASSRGAGRAPATAVAKEVLQGLSRWDSESSEPRLHGHGPQHQLGDRHHLRSHSRTLVVPVHRAGCVFGAGSRLVDASMQDRQLVVHAGLMAVWQRPARTPVILHSDRGCQFTSEEYQRFLEAHQVIGSMSAVGRCADHASAESFFGVLKRERVNRHSTGPEPRPGLRYSTTSSAVTIRASGEGWNYSKRRSNS